MYRFSAEKNALLKAERRVGFEDAIYCIEQGYVLDVIRNKACGRGGQEVYVLELDGYAYAVPFVRDAEGIFLKTIYPSRALTARYLGG